MPDTADERVQRVARVRAALGQRARPPSTAERLEDALERTEKMDYRLSVKEKDALYAAAKQAGMSASEFIRSAVGQEAARVLGYATE